VQKHAFSISSEILKEGGVVKGWIQRNDDDIIHSSLDVVARPDLICEQQVTVKATWKPFEEACDRQVSGKHVTVCTTPNLPTKLNGFPQLCPSDTSANLVGEGFRQGHLRERL